MKQKSLLDQIAIDSWTKTETRRKLTLLREYFENRFFGRKKTVIIEPWIKSLDKKEFNKDNFYKVLDQLGEDLNKTQVLTIYFAVELPQEEIEKIVQTLRGDYGRNFLIESKVDPSLLAGCALAWGDKYKDYSLKKALTDKRQKLLDKFAEYFADKK